MKANLIVQAGLSFFLALSLLLGPAQGPMGEYLVEAQDEVWTTYTNGNYVNDLAVEGDYLWAATEGGVVRWDVRNGTYIKYTTGDGLADNNVEAVAIDLDGSKWFGTYGGVSHFDGTTWTTYDTSNSGLADDSVYAIAIDNDGSKWFGTYGGVSHFDGTIWTTYDTSNSGLADDCIEAIAIDNDGSKWFGTRWSGVSHFDGTTWTTYRTYNSGLADDDIEAIAIDNDGSKWFGTRWSGVSHFDGTTWTTYDTYNSGLADDCIEAIAIDNDGSKWFGTYGSGVSRFDGTAWTTLATTDSLVHNAVQAIAIEHCGDRWFGTWRGVSWLVGNLWVNYTTANSGLVYDDIWAIAIDNDGGKWFAGSFLCLGVSHFDGTTWTIYDTFNSGLANDCVRGIAIDPDGSKWFGTYGGVSHFDGTTWSTYDTSNSGLPDDPVYAVAIDNDGSKWFGTWGSGVSHFDGSTWMTYRTSNSGLADNDVFAIAIDNDGSKWFGTYYSGVSHFDGTTWTTYNTSNSGLADNDVRIITIDNDGGKWFGTYSGGVSHFDGTTWTTYDTSNSGLTDDQVYAIAIENDGTKWFGTRSGLSRFGPPPGTEPYVRVVDEDGNPLPGAWVYRNGTLIADATGAAHPTNAIGVLLVDGLDPSDRLVALAPQHKQPTNRAAHGPPGQSWAFRINVTNAHIDNQGHITTTQTYDSASGEYLLTTARDDTLVTFNLVVSIEWDATDAYMEEIARAVQYASNYLYDLTEGQMAFGQVDICDNGVNWADADIQISTKNIVRPHAYIGGITSDDKSHVIRVGRGWNGVSGNQGPWDQPAGYRTLGHEFGHYALYLHDEYFAYLFDQNGNLIGEVPAYCTGPENRNPATDATNASVMDYQYTTSELSARGVPGIWSSLCEQTAQWQMTERQLGQGESDWETLARMYADTESPPRWQLTTPADRGAVMVGPTGLPAEVLALPTVTITNGAASGPPRQLTVYDPEGEPYWGALVALYKQDGRIIGQGFTDGNGQLKVYGADVGDKLRAASMDGGLTGSVTVTTEMSLTLSLAPVGGLAASGIPHMRVIAEPSQDPSQIDLLVFLQDFGPGAAPSVIVTEPGSEAGYAPTLSYSPSTDTYEGQISFGATERGMGRIRAVGAVGDHLVRLQSTYRLQRVLNNQSHDVYSDDGNLSLHLEPGSLLGSEAYFVVMPPGAVPGSLPDGLVLVGDAYDVTASGALVTLEKQGILTLRYDGALVNEPSAPEGLGIYRWAPNSETWQAVPGSLDEEQRAMVAPVTTLGTYALLAPPGEWNEPSQIFLPIILKEGP